MIKYINNIPKLFIIISCLFFSSFSISQNNKQKALENKRLELQREIKKIAELHYYISEKRTSILHELTHFLTKNYELITVEDLNVKGMVKNRRLARAVSDAGFGKFKEYLEYKAFFRGNTVVFADTFFASSKTCSCCGKIKEDLKLSNRLFKCDSCGLEIDRDLNAAINLDRYGRQTLEGDLKRTKEISKTFL